MFGVFPFGGFYFADAEEAEIPPPPVRPTTSYQVLVLPCNTRNCVGVSGSQGNDFGYSLETAVEPVSPVPCRTRVCENIDDLSLYNLQDALIFNGTPLSRIGECPTGYYCAPGVFPHVFVYPPGTFEVLVPPIVPGFPIILGQQGCSSYVSRVLPAGSSAAAIAAAGQAIISDLANQQAACDSITIAGPASQTVINLTDLDAYACVNVPYSASVVASSIPSKAPYSMQAVSTPPPWMLQSQNTTTLFLTGTPNVIGSYAFTIIATAPDASGSKNYTLNVVGIATGSTLPNATVNIPYSQVLTAPSIPGILSWTVVSGVLPSWLSLNSTTGELFGTPLTGDDTTSNFTIQANNGTGVACSKDFSVTVDAVLCCPDWSAMIWGAPSIALAGSGTGTASGVGANFSGSCAVGPYFGGPANTATVGLFGSMVVNLAVASTCCVADAIVNANPAGPSNIAIVDVRVNGFTVYFRGTSGGNVGTGSFIVPAGAGTVISVTVSLDSASGGGNILAKNCGATGSLQP